ncbi:hypothetical protein BLGI_4697 [Brevibacillus laterosporus GI-9]|uniref:hypothetical protein n=1 Tax=Brevibacillus laterosporus TaxID=1465 RepID=UPI000240524A|nr:hypothetical protein [Brevibacillus laterosporus]CCF16728.1 hypothetical protein BLGI_4697 [Brevibacillus laterosporus GI-9]
MDVQNKPITKISFNTNSYTELPTIEKWENGLCIYSSKIDVEDLVEGLFDLIEYRTLYKMIFKDKGHFENIQKQMIANSGPDLLVSFLDSVLNSIDIENDVHIKKQMELFLVFCRNVNIQQISESNLNIFLKSILSRVQDINDSSVIEKLLLTLLNKADILTTLNHDLVSSTLEQLSKRIEQETEEELLHSMFFKLAMHSKKEWIDEVMDLLAKERRTLVSTPILPKNCIGYRELTGGLREIIIEVDKQRWNVTYYDSVIKSVGHPKMIFVFRIKDEFIESCSIYAVKDSIIRERTRLYRYPFTNVFENHKACWPELRHHKIKKLFQLSTLPHVFLTSPSNNHGYQGSNVRDKFASLSESDFNDEELVFTGILVKDIL